MTRAEFERVAEEDGLRRALHEVGSERILDYEDMQNLVAACVFNEEYGRAKSLIDILERADEKQFWLAEEGGRMPSLVEDVDDVAFLLD